jgi:hypothetical protein
MSDGHRSTPLQLTGIAGRSSFAAYRRFYAWRFI